MPFHEIFAVTLSRVRDKNSCVGRLRIKTVSKSRGIHLRQHLQSRIFTLQVPPEHFLFQTLKTSVDAVFMRVPEDLMQQISRTAYTPLCPQICIKKYQKVGRQNI
jgi:hypothetical protein